MLTIIPKGTDILNSSAHVFVYILERGGINRANKTEDAFQLAMDIYAAVADDKRPGRLWIREGKLDWPPGMSPTPNGRSSRTVWNAMIPQQNIYATNGPMLTSLFLLRGWLKSTGLPLRVAVFNDGWFNPTLAAYEPYESMLEKTLGDFEIEVYRH